MAAGNSPDTLESTAAVGVLLRPDSVQQERPMCRICFSGSSSEQLLKPCDCRGSIQFVHRSCLERWLGTTAGGTACELCRHRYDTVRVPKSFREWIRQDRDALRHMTVDLLCFLVPLVPGVAWLCSQSAQYYYQEAKKGDFQSLFVVAFGAFLSLFYLTVVVQTSWNHYQTWRQWRACNCDVRLLDRKQSPVVSEGADVPATSSEPLMGQGGAGSGQAGPAVSSINLWYRDYRPSACVHYNIL